MIDTTMDIRKPAGAAPATPAWLRWGAIALVIVAFVVAGLQERPEEAVQRNVRPPVAADYQGAWRSSANVDLAKTLAAHQVEGCSSMAWRAHRTVQGQYLVYCSKDGRRWTAWLAWPGAQKVLGPFPPDPLVPPPL